MDILLDDNRNNSTLRLRAQKQFYIERLNEFGYNSARSVGWPDYLQVLLFDKLMNLLCVKGISEERTLLDVGCGLGDLSAYLHSHGLLNIKYYGIDILSEMVSAARQKHPLSDFKVIDFFSPSFTGHYDYIFCSGALNIVTEKSRSEHTLFIMRFIRKMYIHSQRACAFNLLALDGIDCFPKNPSFYYADRDEITGFCASLCGRVKVDYNQHEYLFTVIMEK